MKIVIISHTEHYLNDNEKIVGWGPTIKEINKLLDVASSITHIAPLHKEIAPKSSLSYTDSNRITFIPLKPSGGKGIKKLTILFTLPFNVFQILKGIRKADYIQFRAPTGIGIYVLPLLKLSFKKYWVKYAGNWVDEHMPLGNKLQKLWLKKCTSKHTKVTVNGKWENVRDNVLAFENPCLDKNDRTLGKGIVQEKKLEKKKVFCFVGALNEHKGVHLILDALKQFQENSIEFHFVGDSSERKFYENTANELKCKITFHGFLSKEKIKDVYSKSNFILLPSRSEGFPKVIAEAMNFGCYPVVSNVSCLDQYINNGKNGILLNDLSVDELINSIQFCKELEEKEYKLNISYNFELTHRFTYSYYNNRLKNEILI